MGFFNGLGKFFGGGFKYLLLALVGTWTRIKILISAVTVFFIFKDAPFQQPEEFFKFAGEHILRADRFILDFLTKPFPSIFSIEGLKTYFELFSHIWFVVGFVYLVALLITYLFYRNTSDMPKGVFWGIGVYFIVSIIGSYALGLGEPFGLVKGVLYFFTHLGDIWTNLKGVF